MVRQERKTNGCPLGLPTSELGMSEDRLLQAIESLEVLVAALKEDFALAQIMEKEAKAECDHALRCEDTQPDSLLQG